MSDFPLVVALTVPTKPQIVGAPVPISIEVRNVSAHPLWMVGVLDGSEMGFRFPHYLPHITGPKPLPPPEGLPWCGNVAPLRLQDFHRLLPGEGFDPTAPQHDASYLPLVTFANFCPSSPGCYELRLTLSTESQQNDDWLGILEYPGKTKVLERLAQVPRLRIESNVAMVEVR